MICRHQSILYDYREATFLAIHQDRLNCLLGILGYYLPDRRRGMI